MKERCAQESARNAEKKGLLNKPRDSKIQTELHENRAKGYADADEQRSLVQEKILLVRNPISYPPTVKILA